MGNEKVPETVIADVVEVSSDVTDARRSEDEVVTDAASDRQRVPLAWKLTAILLVSCIGFGGNWSSGITSAMKTKLKKELGINNTQYAILDTAKDFMVTALILPSGLVTDRIGGANAIVYGNIVYSIGSILLAGAAQARSYRFMVGAQVIVSLGDIATQVAQYKIFSSWFPPNNGFASTLGLELGIGKIGAFVGKSTANIIAKNMGFAWTYWMAVIMNLFANLMTIAFLYFTRLANKKFTMMADPATGEKLTEKNKRFKLDKVLQMPWTFWLIMAFSLLETSTAIVFTSNATEIAEQRFNVDSITAGWYSSLLQYAGFFIVPCLGVFIDVLGNRLWLILFCGVGVFIAMALVAWSPSSQGTAAAFGIYAIAYSFGPTLIIDAIRTTMWDASIFGSAYAMKIGMNNAMNIIVGIGSGVIQDRDDDSYDHAVILYATLAAGSAVVAIILVLLSFKTIDLGQLQWTRKQRRTKGSVWNARKERFQKENGTRNQMISRVCFGALGVLVLASWGTFFWGVATGRSD